jgi:hypothetical protein
MIGKVARLIARAGAGVERAQPLERFRRDAEPLGDPHAKIRIAAHRAVPCPLPPETVNRRLELKPSCAWSRGSSRRQSER